MVGRQTFPDQLSEFGGGEMHMVVGPPGGVFHAIARDLTDRSAQKKKEA